MSIAVCAQQGAQAEPSPTLHPAHCCAIVRAVIRFRFGRLSTALGKELEKPNFKLRNYDSMRTLILLLLLSLVGCRGVHKEESELKPYIGIWRSERFDSYYEIDEEGLYSVYGCTLENGYQKVDDITGYVDGNVLVSFYGETRYEDEIVIVDDAWVDSDGNTDERVDSIPFSCFDDAIDVIEIKEVEERDGGIIDFVVAFQYRLSTVNNAIVKVGYSPDGEGRYTVISEVSQEVEKTDLGVSDLHVNNFPFYADGFQNVYLHIHLSPSDSDGEYETYASNEFEIILKVNTP